ncbi:hypothetical protein VE03_10887 [Pseudogymnoascus sp. 23342-1-I1]|nr:hypothetical protein VE03_10887 [Pseudogymnoascus sp. 23342-1-I1]
MNLEPPPPLRKRSSTRTISKEESDRTKYPKTISARFSSAEATTPEFACNKRTEDKQTGKTANFETRCDASDDGASDKITVDSQSDDPAAVEQMIEKLRQLITKRKEKGLSENVRVEREIEISGQSV